jgi:Holin of 3TMs, for gene-transfer release
MSLDPVTGVLDLANTVVKTIWPDKSAQEQQQLAGAIAMVQGQLEINKAEAVSPSVFVAGWRPFIGWVCGTACAWNWIGLSLAKFIAITWFAKTINLNPADVSEMMPVLMGMLGLGGLRTYEKVKGVS